MHAKDKRGYATIDRTNFFKSIIESRVVKLQRLYTDEYSTILTYKNFYFTLQTR